MTTKPECCGNCRHFTGEDALGLGWCALNECETTCGSCCKEHENKTIKNNHNYESKNKKDR